MAKYLTQDSSLTSIANAIRSKSGTSEALNYPDGFISAINNIDGGSSTTSKKQINFIDYNGTILYSYTKAEINAMSSESDLPANPSHTGLTAQGWNWTLAQIKAQLTAMPDGDIWVGQMYITQSGDTEIDLSMQYGRLDPILTIVVDGTITVDWGDNTTADTVTGTSLSTRQYIPHTYASAGNYTMTIHVVSGNFSFFGSSTYTILRKNTTANQNRVYANCVQNIRLGGGITSLGNYAFYGCSSLTSITIPSEVTSLGSNSFYYCYSLTNITIPSRVTSLMSTLFFNCQALVNVTIPSGVTSIGSSVFNYCYSLVSVTIPSGVTSIEASAFYGCSALVSITMPSGVTSIGNNAFNNCYTLASVTMPSGVTSIGNQVFKNCYALASITIPSGVTSIGNNAFEACYGVSEYHILPTAVPTLGSSVFLNIVSDCKLYVPSASLSSYQSDTNWSEYAPYMVGE